MDKKLLDQLACHSAEYNAYESDEIFTWCGGCGNYAIQNALKRALVLEGIKPKEVLMCFDIGCNGNGSDKIKGYTIHGLHGRVLPLAAGCGIGNSKLKMIAFGGDGGTLSEGLGHLVHSVRSNYPMLFLHHDNQNYALTTGQPSATTHKGCQMNAAPDGTALDPLNGLQLVLASNPSFVAQTLSADIDHMTQILRQALRHTGFAFVQILQTCPTYNREATSEWYLNHVIDVAFLKDYHSKNIEEARKIIEKNDTIPIGILYENKSRKSFMETLSYRKKYKTTLTEEVEYGDISPFLKPLGN